MRTQTVIKIMQTRIMNGLKGTKDATPVTDDRKMDGCLFSHLLTEDSLHEIKNAQHALQLLTDFTNQVIGTNESTIEARYLAPMLEIILKTLECANKQIVGMKGIHSLESLGVEGCDVK